MMDKELHTALGLSDTGHVELHDAHSQSELRQWIRQYIRWGDWGGYYGIAIVAPCGDWLETFEKESE